MSSRTDFVENLKAFRSKERAEYEDAIEREEREKIEAPIRAAQAEQNRLLAEIRDAEKQEVVAGRKDPAFVIPESVAGKRMSLAEAQEFAGKEAATFRESCQEFRDKFNTPGNRTVICDYLIAQGVAIADAECFHVAFERLRDLGLLTEKQTVQPEPQPVIEEQLEQQPAPVRYIGIGGREYSERDVWRMSSTEMKAAFGLYGPRLPKFSDVIPA